jgi:integrase
VLDNNAIGVLSSSGVIIPLKVTLSRKHFLSPPQNPSFHPDIGVVMSASKLLDQVRFTARLRHLSLRTERAYVQHIKRFILFHNKQHPLELCERHIRDYLSDLATTRNVSASTQNVALAALLFLYRDVLKVTLDRIDDVERARVSRRLPVVLSKAEVMAVLNALDGVPALAAALMYGSGLRLMECLRLRVKDLDFSYNQITVRSGNNRGGRGVRSPLDS